MLDSGILRIIIDGKEGARDENEDDKRIGAFGLNARIVKASHEPCVFISRRYMCKICSSPISHALMLMLLKNLD